MNSFLEVSKIKIATQILNLPNNKLSVKLLDKLDGYLEALGDIETLDKK